MRDDNLYQEIKHMLHGTSQSIQTKVRDWLNIEITCRRVSKDFCRGKQELVWGLGKWEGERAIKGIENDLNRLEYSLNRAKGNKIRNLQHKKLGLTAENNSRGRESSEGDTGAFIQECRWERCRKRTKRMINKDRKRRYKHKQRRKRDTRADSAW